MKFFNILLVVFSTLFIKQAFAEEVVLMTKVSIGNHKKSSKLIELPVCTHATEIQIKAQAKTEITKAEIHFQSGKNKNIFFFTTLEETEATRWRDLGHYAKDSCVKYIHLRGYPKHLANAVIEIYGKRS